MRILPFITTSSIALVFGTLQVLPVRAQINGNWTSSYGMMKLSSVGNNNYTGTYENGSGKIHGIKIGRNLTGHWIKGNSIQRCNYPVDGSYCWGTVSLNFNSNNRSFNGNWGFCNNNRSASWTGSRTFINTYTSAPFEPRLRGRYTSNHGTIDWSQGWYGDLLKSIRVSSKRWDPASRKYIVTGTWRHEGTSNQGQFEFFFSSECSFNGLWWHTNTPHVKQNWSGSCS